jgi:hypothetical protein
MDEFTKTIVAAALGGGLTILGQIISKALDYRFAIWNEKRDFVKSQKKKAVEEIEELKNQVGTIYELSNNWTSYDTKLGHYAKFFEKDHEVIGRYNKYPKIAEAARNTVHFCKIVASDEKDGDRHGSLISNKRELREKYQIFIQTCDKYIENFV